MQTVLAKEISKINKKTFKKLPILGESWGGCGNLRLSYVFFVAVFPFFLFFITKIRPYSGEIIIERKFLGCMNCPRPHAMNEGSLKQTGKTYCISHSSCTPGVKLF